MKKMLLFLIFVLIFSFAFVSAAQFTYLKAYYDSLDSSCKSDSECVVKNVGNCCGYYPMCTNKDSVLDPTEVASICSGQNNTDCRLTIISYCRCQKIGSGSARKCVGFTGNPTPVCGDSNCHYQETNVSSSYYCPADCNQGSVVVPENQTQENETQQNIPENVCPQLSPLNCPKGSSVESQGKNNNGCDNPGKCIFKLSNGINAEVKIMPETASETAIKRLGNLGFNVTLTEGKRKEGDMQTFIAVYKVYSEKEGKILGLFKTEYEVSAEVDAETGIVLSIKEKPWWVF